MEHLNPPKHSIMGGLPKDPAPTFDIEPKIPTCVDTTCVDNRGKTILNRAFYQKNSKTPPTRRWEGLYHSAFTHDNRECSKNIYSIVHL